MLSPFPTLSLGWRTTKGQTTLPFFPALTFCPAGTSLVKRKTKSLSRRFFLSLPEEDDRQNAHTSLLTRGSETATAADKVPKTVRNFGAKADAGNVHAMQAMAESLAAVTRSVWQSNSAYRGVMSIRALPDEGYPLRNWPFG